MQTDGLCFTPDFRIHHRHPEQLGKDELLSVAQLQGEPLRTSIESQIFKRGLQSEFARLMGEEASVPNH